MSNIEKYDNFGRGITYINDKITFVTNALKGENVDVLLTSEKSKYNEGAVKKIINSSPRRVEAKCPYFGICGGCDLQHMSKDEQQDFKLNKIKELFKINKLVSPSFEFICSDNFFNYRNKITLKVIDGKIGYFENKTHKLIEIDKCLLARECINDVLNELKFDKDCNGEVIIRCNNNDELLIVLNGNLNLNRNDISSSIKIAGIVKNGMTVFGDDFLITNLNNTFYKYSFDSFFQVNDYICEKIFKILRDKIKDGTVLDLYCGVGSLSLQEQNGNNKVYGIEIVDNAIKNAVFNAKINKKDNMFFMLGDVANIVDKIKDKIDWVVVDPPRSGLDSKTLSYIIDNGIKKMIYISCNPNTLVRDLRILSNYYIINEVKVCDMFPNTYHCETFCVLERK